jgi:hypothetical protein
MLMLVIHTTRVNMFPSPLTELESIPVISIFFMVYLHHQEPSTSLIPKELIRLMEMISYTNLLVPMPFKNTSK